MLSPARIKRESPIYEDTIGPDRYGNDAVGHGQSPIYTNSVVSPKGDGALSSNLHSFVFQPPQTSSSRAVAPQQYAISIDNQDDNSQIFGSQHLLAYALHYEVALMRKAMRILMQNRYDNMKEKLCNHLSQFHRSKRLKLNAFKVLHEHLILHYGHRFAKERAESLQVYLVGKRFFRAWLVAAEKQRNNREVVEALRQEKNMTVLQEVFIAWQQACVIGMIRKAQKQTALRFYETQVAKKSLLSMKFFAKFAIKNKYMKQIADARLGQTLTKKVLAGLQQNVEHRRYKQQKMQVAKLFNDLKI